MKKHLSKRLLSLVLAVVLCVSLVLPAAAAGTSGDAKVTFEKVDNDAVSVKPSEREVFEEEENPSPYSDTDMVRVSIVLSGKSTIEQVGTTEDIASNTTAVNYRKNLESVQDIRTAQISQAIGEPLDVAWNLTLAANIISANVEFGQIEAIEKVPGVEEVLIETKYEPAVVDTNEAADPNMSTSSVQIGSNAAWAAGYTGAGSRIAVVDTGIEPDHLSFDASAFQYSLAYRAGLNGQTPEEYKESLDLLDKDEIESVLDQLNVTIDPDLAYISSKIPFAYSYIDENYIVDHSNVSGSSAEHGSHVEGIAAANAYVPNGDGTFSNALDTVKVQGVAPDAQILTMKVFGAGGGAYDSDYMVAIEDAIVLGADSVNLSLGSGNPGMSRNSTAAYQAILENLAKCGTVVTMSAGNSGSWVENANNLGYLYAEDVSMQTDGSPGSFTNSLAVASVDNTGFTGQYLTVGDASVFYTETDYKNEPMSTIPGEQEYILIDGFGTADDWAAVGDALEGKIAVCSRGSISFYQKGDYAAAAGAIATIIYNNTTGTINMDLTDYSHTQPCVSITQADGAVMKAAATAVTDDAGNVLYYAGTLTVSEGIGSVIYDNEYQTMSSFSSWGVPGSLELKPEISAPGGSIYSVNGLGENTYETMSGTSMAAPQVAGMAAVVAQYIRENGLEEKTGLSNRTLAQSLLMSTAVPMRDGESGGQYYPVLQQGAGLANVGAAVSAESYILMGEDATNSYADGKVKAELGDDPDRTGTYSFSFSVNNLTDKPQAYTMSADLFTQDVFLYYANGNYSMDELAMYMDTWTTPLEADASWTVNGQPLEPNAGLADMDFDGDGDIDNDDGQALLDYATGVRASISHAENADLNEDGLINSYDAYLFFTSFSSGAMTVPANGKVDVTVTLKLTAAQKAYLDNYYENGAYVEGYVYVTALTSSDGALGTVHSIPVLGFYGSWSDPSMFDVGSYAEYAAGDEVRIPYLGRTTTNTLSITYHDESTSYYYGGNPLVPDDTYMPERNAINNENGDKISNVRFTSIRNAAASRFLVENLTTGETLSEGFPGAVNSAYYYTNGGSWQNTLWTLNINNFDKAITSASEGDQLQVQLTLAPEYYVDAEGNVAWDALNDGASLTVPMVVDNTAPELTDVSVSLTGNTMTVTASDNQYVAAVALYNNAGSKVYTYTGAKQDIEPGESDEYVLDLSNVNGKKFLLQVFDYAMNATTYKIEMQIGEEVPLPEMIAFDLDNNFWTSFTKDTTYTEIEAYENSTHTFYAATIVDHMVLAATDEGDFYVMPEDDLSDETLITNLGVTLTDMAYNKADGKVYGVAGGYLVTVDKLTGAVDVVDEIGVLTNTLACDANGTFYCNEYGTPNVYSFTLDTVAEPELLVTTNLSKSQYVQAMEINPNTGMLCWTSYYAVSFWGFTFGFAYYYEIDPATGEYTRYNDLWDELSCLIIPEKTAGGSWTTPTDEVSAVELSETELTLIRGGSEQLSAYVLPWTATDRTVTWTTSDETVAIVDSKGVVTGVGAGECVVTATSNLDPTVSASCKVTVELLEVTVHGALQDEEGVLQTFDWNMETDETWTGGQTFNGNIISAASTGKGTAYATNSSGDTILSMDLTTGATASVGAAPVPNADMAYSEFSTEDQDLIEAVYYYYFLPAKDPANITTSAFGFSSYLSTYTGGSEFVGVATDGMVEYTTSSGATVDAEVVYLLDDAGYLWLLKVYATETGYSCGISFFPTTLAEAGYVMTYDNSNNPLSSLAVGEDGNLYFSAFNGDTNVLYRLSYNGSSFDAVVIGNVGSDVWPAVLFEITSNAAEGGEAIDAVEAASTVTVASQNISAEEMLAAASARTGACLSTDAAKVVDNSQKNAAAATSENTQSAPAAGGLNSTVSSNATQRPSVMPLSSSEVGEGEKTVTVTVTAKNAAGEDVTSNNGVEVVTWDPDALTLKSIEVNGDYTSVNDKDAASGSVTFGYVSLAGIKDVATLVFEVKDTSKDTITITHKETNDVAGGYVETLSLGYEHENTEVRGYVAPTCTTDGYTGDTYCTDCGLLLEEGKVIPATGHDWDEWTVTTAPTCTEKGVETRTCKNDATHIETREVEATGHDWGNWVVTTEPTCTAEGVETRTCKNDSNHTETRPVDALGHDYDAVVTEPTCTEQGYTTYTCSRCGDSYVDDYVDALGHDYVAVVTEPTCTEEGYTTHTCSRCGDSYVDSFVEPHGHEYEYVNQKMPTFLEPGYSGDLVCKHCGDVKEYGHVIPATGILTGGTTTPTKPTDPFPFTDVSTGDAFYDAVKYVYEEGLMNGVSDTRFAPQSTLTRAMVVTILYRIEGEPATRYNGMFPDVPNYQWYTDAVEWAAKNQIVTGYTSGKFGPEDPVTREQLAAILYRYAQSKGYDVSASADLSGYADGANVSSYAVSAVKWAVAKNILEAQSGNLQPRDAANRAQVAVAVAAFYQQYVK